ncbi:MAG: hypothetical protein U0798_03185 [Gemmataceae bacterium]
MFLVLLTCALADGSAVEFGKLKAVAPSTWKAEKPANRLRSHQFKLASPDHDLADAELIILPESNPNPDKVFPGWKKTFEAPDGKSLDDLTKTDKFSVGKATVHLLDISGTWNYRERPNDPKSKLEVKPEYRSIWMIVVVGDDAWHIRFSGPQKVVDKYSADVMAWVKSLK